MHRYVFAVVAFLAVAVPAGSAPFSYSESVSGDLLLGFDTATVLVADAGVNSIEGTLSFQGESFGDPNAWVIDQDAVRLVIPDKTIGTWWWEWDAPTLIGGTTASHMFMCLRWATAKSVFDGWCAPLVDTMKAGSYPYIGWSDLAFDNLYYLYYGMNVGGPAGQVSGSTLTYRFMFDSTPIPSMVPEPLPMTLLSLSIGAFAYNRRR
jgi:hypothetical protein